MDSSEARFRRNQRLLWAGQFVSAAGDSVFMVCVAWLAATISEGESALGLTLFAATAPYLLFGWIAGSWVDRGDRRRIMIGSDLVRAGLLLTLPLVVAFTGWSVGLLVILAFCVALASTPFEPARDALVPRLAEGRSLARFNATLQTSSYLARILGLGLGGLLLFWQERGLDSSLSAEDGLLIVLMIDGASFLVSAACLLAIRLPSSADRAASNRHLFVEARVGLMRVVRDPLLRGLLSLTFINNLAIMGTAFVGCTLLVRDTYRGGASELAWIETAMAVGILIGGLAMARFGPRVRNTGRLVLFGWLLDGLTLIPFGWVRSYPLAVALMALHGCFIPMIVVGRTVIIQQYVADADRGKVFSLVTIVVQGTTALAAVIAAALVAATDAPTLFVVAGGIGALCGVIGWSMIPALRRYTSPRSP